MKKWKSPIYKFGSDAEPVVIDVTTSISASLPPHKVVVDTVIPEWRKRGLEQVLDFGAGGLRHTFPLLRRSFQVCAVEFPNAFERPKNKEAIRRARNSSNFTALVSPEKFFGRHWRRECFRDKRRKFDAVLLCFVLQTMPRPEDRKVVVKTVTSRLKKGGCLLYMSRYGQMTEAMRRYRVSDGYYTRPAWPRHSFYREFATAETHALFKSAGLERIRSLSARGTEQVFLYWKPAVWP